MKHLLIYLSQDAYSHQLRFHKQYVCTVEEVVKMYVDQFKESLQSKVLSALHILGLDLDPANGKTEVFLNEYGTNPLKSRLEINTAVLEKRAKTSASPYKWGELEMPVQMEMNDPE